MKRFFATLFVVLLFVLCLYLICRPAALPTSDLASPSQEVRDAAAKTLRANAKPPWKIKWLLFTSHIKAGETETNILELLHSYNLKAEPGRVWGSLSTFAEYQLDDYWVLGCEFNNNDYQKLILEKWKVMPRWRDVFILPPTNFSGVWITYYANGQKANEEHYKDGMRSGELVGFESDGSIRATEYFEDGKRHGLWTQYFPSLHQIQMQRQFSNNLQIADEIWYYTNGSVSAIKHYEDGKYNGPSKKYFPSGKIESQCLYSNYTKVGLEVKYNEDGTTNSVKDYSHP
jgi:antitoxin component YwqK of YwqJK toxin-antitoxin module